MSSLSAKLSDCVDRGAQIDASHAASLGPTWKEAGGHHNGPTLAMTIMGKLLTKEGVLADWSNCESKHGQRWPPQLHMVRILKEFVLDRQPADRGPRTNVPLPALAKELTESRKQAGVLARSFSKGAKPSQAAAKDRQAMRPPSKNRAGNPRQDRINDQSFAIHRGSSSTGVDLRRPHVDTPDRGRSLGRTNRSRSPRSQSSLESERRSRTASQSPSPRHCPRKRSHDRSESRRLPPQQQAAHRKQAKRHSRSPSYTYSYGTPSPTRQDHEPPVYGDGNAPEKLLWALLFASPPEHASGHVRNFAQQAGSEAQAADNLRKFAPSLRDACESAAALGL
ncbi:unnamed protein product, partial [Polarella glacialis]